MLIKVFKMDNSILWHGLCREKKQKKKLTWVDLNPHPSAPQFPMLTTLLLLLSG